LQINGFGAVKHYLSISYLPLSYLLGKKLLTIVAGVVGFSHELTTTKSNPNDE
jgi:hypothetical protein